MNKLVLIFCILFLALLEAANEPIKETFENETSSEISMDDVFQNMTGIKNKRCQKTFLDDSSEKKAVDEYVDSRKESVKIEGLLLVKKYDDLKEDVKIKGLVTKNIDLPGPKKILKSKLEAVFLNKTLSEELISEIKKTITQFYSLYDHPFVTVFVPQQEVTCGVLQMIVVEGRVGKISVKNNRYIPTQKILEGISIKPDNHIDMDILLSDVDWMNRNPFQNASLLFKEGQKSETTNIDVMIKDRFPLRAYTGADNSGSQFTGYTRWFGGFNLGNIFYENQILSYQYTSSLDFKKFSSNMVNFSKYLFFHHILSVYGGYAKVKPEIPGLKNEGTSSQISMRYDVPFGKIYGFFKQGIVFGFDFKSTDNNVATAEEIEAVAISTNAEITQFLFNYYFSLEQKRYKGFFSGNLFVSPMKWFRHQNETNYNNIRELAKPRYLYCNVCFDQEFKLPAHMKIILKAQGQMSFANLLPSELLDLGGESTVRGYQNRLINRENGVCFNLELFAPKMKLFGHYKNIKDELEIFAFLDYGYGIEHKKTSESINEKNLFGTGLALKYRMANHLNVKFEWGYPILKVLDNNSSKVYLQGIISF